MSYIMLAGRSHDALVNLEERLKANQLNIRRNDIVNGHADPLHGIADLPSVLVLLLNESGVHELEAFAERPAQLKPPLVVVGNDLDPNVMRLAMQAGARDFLKDDATDDEFVAILSTLHTEVREAVDHVSIAVVSASGGNGASTVALNIAALAAEQNRRKTALVDLDLQNATLSHMLDLKPKRSILEALEIADELDEYSLGAYMSEHASGIQFIAATPSVQIVQRERLDQPMTELCIRLGEAYQRVVYDIPNPLDYLSASVLEQVDHVLIVMEQSVISVRNATRLNELLRHELDIPERKISAVVNRFNKKSLIDVADIKNTGATAQRHDAAQRPPARFRKQRHGGAVGGRKPELGARQGHERTGASLQPAHAR